MTDRRKAPEQIMRKAMSVQVRATADENVVEVIMSTPERALDGHVLVPEGCDLTAYNANPIFLREHDPAMPVGNAENIQITDAGVTCAVRFAPTGISAVADETRGLVKAGVIRAVSVNFIPLEGEPLDRVKGPKGGMRFTKWRLLECSFVSIPSDAAALVTARAQQETDMAKKLSDEKRAALVEGLKRALPGENKRGLYEVSSLAYALCSLGYAHDSAVMESLFEGDDSPVPAMLGEALKVLADAFLAMAEEEVGELLAGHNLDDDELAEGLDVEGRAFARAGKTPMQRAWRRGIAQFRAGKTLTSANKKKLDEASDHVDRAAKKNKSLGDNHDAVGGHLDEARAAHERAEAKHSDVGEQLESARSALEADDPKEAKRSVERAAKSHDAQGEHMDDAAEAHDKAADRHADVGDDHAALGRSIKHAATCMRAVTGSQDGEESDDTDPDADPGDDEEKKKRAAAEAAALIARRQREVEVARGVLLAAE